MEEIIGSHHDDLAFDRYLADWRGIMNARIAQATERIGDIDGVHGLVLAGSNGLGNPWPLSDIDLIPIYADSRMERAIELVEQTRVALLDEWSSQGWRTGLDVGRLRFGAREVRAALERRDADPEEILGDDRWYYSIDKGYRGRAPIDPDGLAANLAAWFTANRFAPPVVALRLERSGREARASLDAVETLLDDGDVAAAWAAFLKAIQWRQIHLMERWGERDNSLGRFGTRFEIAARTRGLNQVAKSFNTLSSLDADCVRTRLENAPGWVHERNDRSWKARLAVGEPVSRLQSDRDVLRVCTMYELRVAKEPPFAGWLGIPDAAELRASAVTLGRMLDFPERSRNRE